MIVKARLSFSGTFTMYAGEVKECNDNVVLQDLLKCGYIEEVKEEKNKKDVKNNASKRDNHPKRG